MKNEFNKSLCSTQDGCFYNNSAIEPQQLLSVQDRSIQVDVPDISKQ